MQGKGRVLNGSKITQGGGEVRHEESARTTGSEPVTMYQSAGVVHADKAFCCANNVVLDAGHPLPDPFKFCKVINAAVIRAL